MNKKPWPALDTTAVRGLSQEEANKPGTSATTILHPTADVLRQK